MELGTEVLQGYSEVLNLHLRREYGELGWYDLVTGRHIPTYDDQVARAAEAEARADEAERRAFPLEEHARALEARLRRRGS